MTLRELIDEWNFAPYSKKVSALQKVLDFVDTPYQRDEELLADMLLIAANLEDDDYFGTEGLDV